MGETHRNNSDCIDVVVLVATGNGTERMTAPEETQADVAGHGFWNRGTTALLDICIVNLEAGFCLHMTSEKVLAKEKKDKKYK